MKSRALSPTLTGETLLVFLSVLIVFSGCTQTTPTPGPTPKPSPPAVSISPAKPKEPDFQTQHSTSGHTYFSGGPEFKHRLRAGNGALVGEYKGEHGIYLRATRAKYISKDEKVSMEFSPQPANTFHFEALDTGSQVNLFVPPRIAEDIKLSSGAAYEIVSQVESGWPTAYGLIISQGANLVFMGIADWRVDGQVTIDDAFLPISNLPVKVEQTRVLTDHYYEDDIWRRTNTEIRFSVDGKSITMHQGESSLVGDYKISLLIAVEVQYKRQLVDAGVNKISYTIARVTESKPSAATAPAEMKAYFPDPALNDAIRKTIPANSRKITRLDLVGLKALGAPMLGITSLSGLEHCRALTWLNLHGNQIEDIAPLSNLTNLHYLDLSGNKISDLSPLDGLNRLSQIYVGRNPLNDASIHFYVPQLQQRGVDFR